jgi:hypothetical protein
MSARRFIAVVFGCAVFVTILISVLNFAVDPYWIFDRQPVRGFNALKPAVEAHEPMMKAYQAMRVAPRTIIVGSSRTDIGLDPESPSWPDSLRPIYNFSMVGSGIATQLRAVKSLLDSRDAGSRPRTLIVGLDFEAFLDRPNTPIAAPVSGGEGSEPDEQADRLAALAHARGAALPPIRIVKDYASALFTLSALNDSLATLAANRRNGGASLQSDGKLSDGLLRQWTESDGSFTLFAQKNRVFVEQFRAPRQTLSDTPLGPIRDFVYLNDLFALAKATDMTLVLAVQPAHAERLELLDAMGYWPDYERWKKELATLAASARASGVRVTVWDFGGYEPIVQEVVPPKGDRRHAAQWFWDPAHYKVALGDRMIAAMNGVTTDFPATALLTPETVDARLAGIRRDRDEYRRQHAAALVALRSTLCSPGGCADPRAPL